MRYCQGDAVLINDVIVMRHNVSHAYDYAALIVPTRAQTYISIPSLEPESRCDLCLIKRNVSRLDLDEIYPATVQRSS